MSNTTLPKSFLELVNTSDIPVFVDFWAEWCGPCHTVTPAVERIAQEYKGRLLVVKINIDEKPNIAAQYQVQGIPALMVLYKGKVVGRQNGAVPYATLAAMVDQALHDAH